MISNKQVASLQYWLLTGFAIIFAWGLFGLNSAEAHESRPYYVEINEEGNGLFRMVSKVPASVPGFNRPSIELPEGCQYQTAESKRASLRRFQCQEGLTGKELRIVFPLMNPSISSLIRMELLNGQVHNARLGPKQDRWEVPATESFSQVAKDYALLGVEHILEGYDHLLFLACLLFIAGGLRKIVITVTGFTLAHSVTLVASSMGWVYLPVPAIEAVIALSIVFLARELVLNRRDTLTWQRPVLVSVSFGLLHGFGFAAVLQDIGLPQTELPAALLFFNIGVEIGQLLFVLTAALVFVVLNKLLRGFAVQGSRLQVVSGYMVGCLACFWLMERLAAF